MRTLITIPISHYCEKARWALERGKLPYTERPHVQGIHRLAARRAGGVTVPVLVCEEGVLTESRDIVAYADRHAPPERRLGPGDPVLERELDEGYGPDGRLWMYESLRERRDIAIAYVTPTVPAWERRLFTAAFPAVQLIIDRVLDVSAEAAARAERAIDATLDRIAERLSDGRPYLNGERFSATDLTFAALSAPVVIPPQYGVPLPQPEILPAPMAARVRGWREHPAGAFALRLFAEERR